MGLSSNGRSLARGLAVFRAERDLLVRASEDVGGLSPGLAARCEAARDASMRGLVTGGAGFIGYHLAAHLVDIGWEVRILDNLDSRVHAKDSPRLPPEADFTHGDIQSPADCRRALEGGVDVVFHEAALCGLGGGVEDAADFLSTNALGTLNLLRIASASSPRPHRIVLASSMAIYGEGAYECTECGRPQPGRRLEEDLAEGQWEPLCPTCRTPLTPRAVPETQNAAPATMYARSKWLQEEIAIEAARRVAIPLVALRYHNVYGPYLPRNTPYAAVASIFRSRLAADLAPQVFEDGQQLRDFVHVRDVVHANLLAAEAAESEVAFHAFNIGSGEPHSILDFARRLTRSLAPGREPEVVGGFRLGDPRHVFASVAKAEERLRFRAQVGWEDGIDQFAREPLRPAPEDA